jgi:hypothetical protein
VSPGGYDYGNARLAARRAGLPDRALLRRLGQAAGPGELVALLGQQPAWRAFVARAGAADGDARTAAEQLVERWRSNEEGGILAYYDPPVLPLVEALVMPVDLERALEILRRRRAGPLSDETARRLVPGALLAADDLQRLARAPSEAGFVAGLARAGLLALDALPALLAMARGSAPARGAAPAHGAAPARDGDARAAEMEGALVRAVHTARLLRARGGGADAAEVRALLAAEAADRAAVAAELATRGPAAAAVLERTLALARWADRVRRAHRDPLGVGPVVAFVAAVELAVVRLRAVIAQVAGGWHEEEAAAYLVVRPGGS